MLTPGSAMFMLPPSVAAVWRNPTKTAHEKRDALLEALERREVDMVSCVAPDTGRVTVEHDLDDMDGEPCER